MPTFNPEINLGQIITVATIAVGLLIGLGKLLQRFDDMHNDLKQLMSDFLEHVKEDDGRFKEIWTELRKRA